MQGIEIVLEEAGDRGRYVHRVDGDEAELTFAKIGNGRIIARHTGVPDRFRGQGIAQALVERLVADAREKGLRIVPSCSYVAAQFRRHPDWADVLAD